MSKARILVVEDEAIVAADLANKLEQLGYQVVDSTDTGEEAIRLAGELRPSLVLMDIRLAGAVDGVEAAKAIRREWNLPVVFLTAHSEWATLQRAGEAEAFGYLLKPFHERELGAQIAMALYKHAAENRLRESEEQLRSLNESLEQQVAKQTDILSLLQYVTRLANEARTVEEAFRAALERIAGYNGWQLGHVWNLAGDGSRQMVSSGIWYVAEGFEGAGGKLEDFQRAMEVMRFSPGEGLVGAVIDSKQVRWLDGVEQFHDRRREAARRVGLSAAFAFPVMVDGQAAAVLEFFAERPARREERLLEIMPDIGIQLGHVIERQKLQQDIDTATTRQMRSIALELHDGVAQQLTGSAMMTQVLLENLQEDGSPHVSIVDKLDNNLRDALNQVRLLSQGLMPVEIDAEGLMQALQRLVQEYRNIYGVEINFQCDSHVTMENNDAATHLYRIAQEAILNAVKHGTTQYIEVSLGRIRNDIVLTVEDDGGGFQSGQESAGGSGVRIMQHRAALIGGQLKIESEEGVGVRVTCRVRIPESAE
jgi:signal transduction histidine kinase/DNA-binding response OmpR family regulator